jgi:hypothetical protein
LIDQAVNIYFPGLGNFKSFRTMGWWQYVTSGVVVLDKGKDIPVTGCGGP